MTEEEKKQAYEQMIAKEQGNNAPTTTDAPKVEATQTTDAPKDEILADIDKRISENNAKMTTDSEAVNQKYKSLGDIQNEIVQKTTADQAKLDKRARAAKRIAQIGDVASAFGNLFAVNKGALPTQQRADLTANANSNYDATRKENQFKLDAANAELNALRERQQRELDAIKNKYDNYNFALNQQGLGYRMSAEKQARDAENRMALQAEKLKAQAEQNALKLDVAKAKMTYQASKSRRSSGSGSGRGRTGDYTDYVVGDTIYTIKGKNYNANVDALADAYGVPTSYETYNNFGERVTKQLPASAIKTAVGAAIAADPNKAEAILSDIAVSQRTRPSTNVQVNTRQQAPTQNTTKATTQGSQQGRQQGGQGYNLTDKQRETLGNFFK